MAEDKAVVEDTEDEGGSESTEENSTFTQDDVNRIVSERLERERTNQPAREDIEAEVRNSIEADLRAEKAKEDEDWESYASGLAEQVIARDEKLTALKTDKETATQERDALKERVENLEKRVKASVKKRVESVPESLRPLVNEAIANKTPEEQETWLEKNAASFAAPQDPLGSPATPAGSRNNGDKEQDKQVEAQERYRAFQAV